MLAGWRRDTGPELHQEGVQGYIGHRTLMEIGVAYYLKKQIYLMYPYQPDAPFALEMDCVEPTIINGNVNLMTGDYAKEVNDEDQGLRIKDDLLTTEEQLGEDKTAISPHSA